MNKGCPSTARASCVVSGSSSSHKACTQSFHIICKGGFIPSRCHAWCKELLESTCFCWRADTKSDTRCRARPSLVAAMLGLQLYVLCSFAKAGSTCPLSRAAAKCALRWLASGCRSTHTQRNDLLTVHTQAELEPDSALLQIERMQRLGAKCDIVRHRASKTNFTLYTKSLRRPHLHAGAAPSHAHHKPPQTTQAPDRAARCTQAQADPLAP